MGKWVHAKSLTPIANAGGLGSLGVSADIRSAWRTWIFPTLIWITLLASITGLYVYKKHKSEIRKKELAAYQELERKVAGNYENYLKAAPLLKGNAAKAFASETESRVQEMLQDASMRVLDVPGIQTYADYKTLTPAEKWRRVSAAVARKIAEDRATERTALTAIKSDTDKCGTAGFSREKCKYMIELVACRDGYYCTQAAWDALNEWAYENERFTRDEWEDQ